MTQELVEKLRKNKLEIATMESCTGGALANEITSIEGASEILKFSAVTYSNEYKIKMGVSKDIIDKFSVYSIETAKEMSKNISLFANSQIGIGITGTINNPDPSNLTKDNNLVYISIYLKEKDTYYNEILKTIPKGRKENKQYIIEKVIEKLLKII